MKILIYSDENIPSIEEYNTEIKYIDRDVLKVVAESQKQIAPKVSKRDVIDINIENLMATINERFDTYDYSFLYLTQPTPHGNNDVLMYVTADGECRLLDGELNLPYASTIKITKLNIDKELGIVTFTANSSYRYAFNLLTGELISL